MRVYVASSWRNPHQPGVVEALKAAGHEVYDFRNPAPGEGGFGWHEIDPNWQAWTPAQYLAALQHPIAKHGFGRDMEALKACEACVLVMPCGRSAHLELGWAVGAGRRTLVLLDGPSEPELMYGMTTRICESLDQVLAELRPTELHVFFDDYEWYVAKDKEDAAALQRELTGMSIADQTDLGEGSPGERFGQWPDDKELGVWIDEEMKEKRTKTCREWAAEKGRGFLCGLES